MANFSNINILVVEDDRDSRDLLFRILEKTGAKVIVAETGEKAIELIKSDLSIKIVLMDIRLPDIDGFITTRKIKDLRPNLPVIAQTAYAMYNDKELCLENGCDDYISKPLNRNLLFDILNKYLYN
ncbi:MAG TPA: response regulator [Bacteroidales bacterium]|nr:response regulator [Bacteroidales bacterium]